MAICNVCFRKCDIREGKTGFCRARGCRTGAVLPLSYGYVTGLALDPIEKKPLNRFLPGTQILSVGSFGCNLDCPYCQNFEIARGFADDQIKTDAPALLYRDEDGLHRLHADHILPEQLAALALQLKDKGNIGVAYTYNEPLIAYEFVADTAKLVKENGMKNVLVTNGSFSPDVTDKVIPYIDAANIDLKCFSEEGYKGFLGGDITFTKEFIRAAAERIHVEITTLIVPGFNDSEEEMREEAAWIAGLNSGRGADIPLHISRFFPRHRMSGEEATPVAVVYRLADVAREYLKYVYTGNC